jgi:diacylglycerol kinase
MENNWKNPNFIVALKNSLNGILYTLKSGRNFKIQLVFAVLALILSFIFKISLLELAIIVLTIFLVLFAEMVNTAIETVTDMYTEEYNEKAKIAKDVAAGGVTLCAICSIIIGIIIFIPKILY